MIKLLVSTPTEFDSTSFYRCWGVLHNLNKKMHGRLLMDSFGSGAFNWSKLAGYHILFLHRPCSMQVLQLAQYCKQIGIKIWVDHDDNLFNLPPENRAFDNFNKLDVKKVMRGIMDLADVITVSTQPLHTFFTQNLYVQAPVHVIPNALNDDFFKPVTAFNEKQNYCWRGSDTHHADVLDYTTELYEAMHATTAPWYWLGYKPWLLMRDQALAARIHYSEPADPILYHSNLKQLQPHIMHVPLSHNGLNECKSNIAWIEATYAGAVTIAPNITEWQRPGIINYNSPTEYKEMLINPPANLAALWQQSHDYIHEHLRLSVVNEQRQDIIEKLLSNHKEPTLELQQNGN